MPFNFFPPPGNAYLWIFIEELLLCFALKEYENLYDLSFLSVCFNHGVLNKGPAHSHVSTPETSTWKIPNIIPLWISFW